jgi:phosphatidylglycerophosphate synthase
MLTNVDILVSAIVLAGSTLVLAAVAANALDLGSDYIVRSGAVFGIALAFVWSLSVWPARIEFFGPANRITLLRVAMISLVAATLGEPSSVGLSWTIICVTTVALFVDGLDGRIARRTNSMSAFGARFDMETDAALILILSVLCWHFGKAGIWILAAGAMRYAFVLASYLFRWMRAPLPYSRRRQTVCIWQSGLLLGVISPLFPRPASDILAFGTLVMLGTSFVIDIHWLWAQPRATQPVSRPRPWHRIQKQ